MPNTVIHAPRIMARFKQRPRPKDASPPRRSGLSESPSPQGKDKPVEDKAPSVSSSRCVTPSVEATQQESTSAREVVPSSVSPSPCASPTKHKASEALESDKTKRVKFSDDTKAEEID